MRGAAWGVSGRNRLLLAVRFLWTRFDCFVIYVAKLPLRGVCTGQGSK